MSLRIVFLVIFTGMKSYPILLLFLFSLILCPSNAQDWHQVYFSNRPSVANSVYETYDKGYILGGTFTVNSGPGEGMVIKTDINGELLWYKTIGLPSNGISIKDINRDYDNGYIITGGIQQPNNNYNPFIMKLNVCGEKEWCNIYYTPDLSHEWGRSIRSIPGGYIALLWVYGEDSLNQRICLYRLDTEGELIWKQFYAQSDTAILNETSVKMMVTNDFHYIINGYCYYPNPGAPWPKYLRPFVIKVDNTGALVWELPWSDVNGENYYGQSYMSVVDNSGNIYSSGRHIMLEGPNPGDKPSLIKTDNAGNEVLYSNLLPLTDLGLTHTINWFTDSTLALGAGWVYTSGGGDSVGVFKTDREGNVLDNKWIFNSSNTFRDGETTFDNKLLLVGGFWQNIWRSHAFKLNSNLEYDSVYTTPLVYDSLCPYPIPSDTIYPDCLIVGIDDPFVKTDKNRLKVYPNPASTILHIEIPTYLKTTNQIRTFTVATIHYQWNQTRLEIYNLFGQLMIRKEIPAGKKLVDVDISGWKEGLYVVKLIYGKEGVGNAKVLIER